MEKTQLVNGEYYHIYNRGVAKQNIFCDERDFLRFLTGMKEFNSIEPVGSLYANAKRKSSKVSDTYPDGLVEFICYCVNLNHFHSILKQLVSGGISEFMKRLGGGYANYFNEKYKCSGHLFQGKYQSKHIDNNEYLLWLSGYVNGNSEIHKIAKAEDWKWGSCQDYFGLRNSAFCNKEIILSQFKSIEEYRKYVKMVIEESSRRKEEMKEYILE